MIQFPTATSTAIEWLKAIEIPELFCLSLTEIHERQLGICTRHFKDSDYECKETSQLKRDAIPKIYQEDDEPPYKFIIIEKECEENDLIETDNGQMISDHTYVEKVGRKIVKNDSGELNSYQHLRITSYF